MANEPLSVGDIAPDFTLPRDGGETVTLSDHLQGRVVLFFYPKDNTPGCTTEAQDFSAHQAAFQAAGVTVLGVSKDSVRKHDNFRDKHGLTVPLLSDADSDVCERFGVWGEKKNYGRSYFGITRTTFLIGTGGKILKVWPKVRVKEHVAQVLAAAQAK